MKDTDSRGRCPTGVWVGLILGHVLEACLLLRSPNGEDEITLQSNE